MSRTAVAAGLRQPSRYIPQLESLRGWAILLVVGFHYFGILSGSDLQGLPADSPLALRIVAAGNTGVTLFFVLSGFLLAQPFILALREGERVSLGGFYTARLLRIVPLYYLAVLVAWLVSSNSAGALKALLFIPVGFEIFPFSVPWWSLCTEMQFYLLLPLVMLALRYRSGRYLVLFLGGVWFAAHTAYSLWPDWLGNLGLGLQASLFGRGFAFLVGAVCSWLYVGRGRALLSAFPRGVAPFFLLLLAAMFMLLQWYGTMGQKPALVAMPLYHDLEAVLWGGLLLGSLGLTGWLRKLFINPLLSHFGAISYSLYLVHVPVQFYLIYPVTAGQGGSLAEPRLLAVVAASFLLSWLLAVACYHMVEMPFLRLKSHLPVLTDKLRGRPARA